MNKGVFALTIEQKHPYLYFIRIETRSNQAINNFFHFVDFRIERRWRIYQLADIFACHIAEFLCKFNELKVIFCCFCILRCVVNGISNKLNIARCKHNYLHSLHNYR